MNAKVSFFVMLVGWTLAGCSEPPNLVPVALPGREPQRIPPPTIGSEAEAIGEDRRNSLMHPRLSDIVSEPTPIGEMKKTATGLNYVTLKAGDGPIVKAGQKIKVNYVARLENGTKFDSSTARGEPTEVEIGVGRAIKGWDTGIPGMKIGEKRRLVLPADLGLGASGAPPLIPAESTVIYEVEVIEAR